MSRSLWAWIALRLLIPFWALGVKGHLIAHSPMLLDVLLQLIELKIVPCMLPALSLVTCAPPCDLHMLAVSCTHA